jgi:hypothetical protein
MWALRSHRFDVLSILCSFFLDGTASSSQSSVATLSLFLLSCDSDLLLSFSPSPPFRKILVTVVFVESKTRETRL